jgi:hypothetical protein
VIAQRDAVHAHTVLRGLGVPGGGMVAAATTSLPERAEAGRNYDYRYAWIRDQCYAGEAAAAAGSNDLLDSAVAFVGARLREHGAAMAPAYLATSGAPVPDEVSKTFLPGYPGGKVKTGNWVNDQFQLDAFGESLLLFAAARRTGPARHRRMERPGDRGRGGQDTVARQRRRNLGTGTGAMDPLHAHLCRRSQRSRRCRSHRSGIGVDRARRRYPRPLRPHLRTPLRPVAAHQHRSPRRRRPADARHPRRAAATGSTHHATLAAVLDELTDDGYVYRYRADNRPLGDAEGAFLLCGFATSLATHRAGDRVDAVRWFERARSACGPAGLYGEEYDIHQRQLRGNLPQAFVHALLLECAVRLSA